MPPRLLPIAGNAGATMVCSRAERNIASMMPATIARTVAWSMGAVAGDARESSVEPPAGATVNLWSGAARVLMLAAGWHSLGRPPLALQPDFVQIRGARRLFRFVAFHRRRARRGNFKGHSTIWSS